MGVIHSGRKSLSYGVAPCGATFYRFVFDRFLRVFFSFLIVLVQRAVIPGGILSLSALGSGVWGGLV